MKIIVTHIKQHILKTLLITGLSFISVYTFAQGDSIPPDPGAITVYLVQNMSFGAFSNGASGGTVNMGVQYFQAIFDVDSPIGSIISILNGSDAVLTGSNGGSMTMHIGGSDPPSPFIVIVNQPARTAVSIGGTLTVGNTAANPPGTYNGTFYITFNQE